MAHVDQKMWDEVMAVNVTANYRLIRSLDVLLRQSDAGRAVFVTSGLANKCWAYWGPYSISKAALEAMVKTYAAEVATTSLRVNCFSPGATRTGMRAKAMPGEDPMSLPHPDDVAAQIVPMCEPAFSDNGGVWKYRRQGPVQAVLTP
jgi:NAD(P)-dependent dehydrogenase (short-subunit alcohol dehydrogenase family)